MLGSRSEAEAWSPPPLPDLPQFRDPAGDPPPPRESKSSKKSRTESPKLEAPPLGLKKPETSKSEPRKPESVKDEPPRSGGRLFERPKLEVPPEALDAGPYQGDEPPIYEERPRQPTAATVGALLAQTRAGFGQDIEEVSAALRIRPVFLRAIEESRYQDLPGLTYGVGFVRSYAHYLGLDVNDCVERFKDEAAGIDRTPNLNFPTPVPEAKVPTGAIILVSLLLAGLAYLVWTYVSRDGGSDEVQTAATETVAPASSGASAATETTTTTSTASTTSASSATTSDGDGGSALSAQAATPPAATAAETTETASAEGQAAADETPAAAVTESEGVVAGAAGAAGTGTMLFTEAASATQPTDPATGGQTAAAYSGPRVVLRATQDSWVQVRNASNASIYTRVLRAGDTYDVPDEPGLTLLTGNAGGLVILVDGQEVPKLGRSGQVRRNVSLNPDSLKAN